MRRLRRRLRRKRAGRAAGGETGEAAAGDGHWARLGATECRGPSSKGDVQRGAARGRLYSTSRGPSGALCSPWRRMCSPCGAACSPWRGLCSPCGGPCAHAAADSRLLAQHERDRPDHYWVRQLCVAHALQAGRRRVVLRKKGARGGAGGLWACDTGREGWGACRAGQKREPPRRAAGGAHHWLHLRVAIVGHGCRCGARRWRCGRCESSLPPRCEVRDSCRCCC